MLQTGINAIYASLQYVITSLWNLQYLTDYVGPIYVDNVDNRGSSLKMHSGASHFQLRVDYWYSYDIYDIEMYFLLDKSISQANIPDTSWFFWV